jgi:lipopolysaccharide/colanic/teichoic acid biosynthesis glycosyltransferase
MEKQETQKGNLAHQSLMLDMKILFLTPLKVLRREGVTH